MWFGSFNPNINLKICLFIFDKLKQNANFGLRNEILNFVGLWIPAIKA